MLHRVPWRRAVVGAATAALVMPLAGMTPASASDGLAPVSDTLKKVLSSNAKSATVFVHGTSLGAANKAVSEAGLKKVTSFDKIGVVAAKGSVEEVEDVRAADGVSYVENNDKIVPFASSGTTATRSKEAQQGSSGAQPLTGKGVSVAIVDTGIDPLHPAFKDADGKTRVVKNLKALCPADDGNTSCIVDDPTKAIDTDTLSGGGHGTHVSGIAAGAPYDLSDGTEVGGSAPGSKVVSVSTGAALLVIGANSGLNWILENHDKPCGEGVSAEECPPVKVINNSYGPSGGGEFDENSVTVKLQRELAKEGVLTVWANGNDGGDGSENLSNPPGTDPTPGIVSVASYFDKGTGTRDGNVSDFSSRGKKDDKGTWPDISAPGEEIVSSCRLTQPICSTGLEPHNGPGPLDLGTYNVISGTSMAAPQITGIIAQLFEANPDATPAEVEDALKSTAHKFSNGAEYEEDGEYTSSFDKGTGLVDVVEAAKKLAG